MTRATYEMITGHPLSALGDNALWPLAALLLGWVALAWIRPRWPRPTRLPSSFWIGTAGMSVVFGVLRNMPAFGALAP
jgi:hypothetical protein